MIAAPKSERQQPAGDAIDGPVELGPGHADCRLGKDHCIAVGEAAGRLPQRRSDRQTVDPRRRRRVGLGAGNTASPRAIEESCQPAAAGLAEVQFGKSVTGFRHAGVATVAKSCLYGVENRWQ